MKKFPLIAGLGMLATCGAVFAAWSFGYTPTAPVNTNMDVSIGVDKDFPIGMHGILALDGTGIATANIVQDSENKSAKFAYDGDPVYTLTYTSPADDGNPDPTTFSYTVNAVVSSTLNGVQGIVVDSTPIALTITQSQKSATVRVSDLLGKITFPAITTEKKAQEFVDAIKKLSTKNITFTFTAAA